MNIGDELKILLRYGISGAWMTLIGSAIIFLFMKNNFNLFTSNFLGYLFTICISFFLNKFYVFHSKQKSFLKFIFFFFIAYLINILALYLCSLLAINPYLTQSIAILSYATSMYFFLRTYVFFDT